MIHPCAFCFHRNLSILPESHSDAESVEEGRNDDPLSTGEGSDNEGDGAYKPRKWISIFACSLLFFSMPLFHMFFFRFRRKTSSKQFCLHFFWNDLHSLLQVPVQCVESLRVLEIMPEGELPRFQTHVSVISGCISYLYFYLSLSFLLYLSVLYFLFVQELFRYVYFLPLFGFTQTGWSHLIFPPPPSKKKKLLTYKRKLIAQTILIALGNMENATLFLIL